MSYVASRSEVLSVLFYYAAFAVFLWGPGESMTLLRALAILVLFAAAAGSKEHTLTLPLLLLLTDYFWSRGGIRKNRALYALAGRWPRSWADFMSPASCAREAAGFRLQRSDMDAISVHAGTGGVDLRSHVLAAVWPEHRSRYSHLAWSL